MDLSAGAAIRENPGSAAGAAVPAAAAASMTTALASFHVWSHFVLVWPYHCYCYGFSRHGIRVTLHALVRVARDTAS